MIDGITLSGAQIHALARRFRDDPELNVSVWDAEDDEAGISVATKRDDSDAIVIRLDGRDAAEVEREEAEEAAKERATCSVCLARTYRGEECVCDDGGDAEDYDEALAEEVSE